MSVELIWEGKYLDQERKQKRSPLKISLPFQTIETVNESAQERQRSDVRRERMAQSFDLGRQEICAAFALA